jgi:hypothetical protein
MYVEAHLHIIISWLLLSVCLSPKGIPLSCFRCAIKPVLIITSKQQPPVTHDQPESPKQAQIITKFWTNLTTTTTF